jgi:adenylate cyclase
MPDDPQSRRLTTIVALDVAGYSARTEADEARTTAEVAALRRVIEDIATAKGGRVFNTAGDGFMLEFGSSLAAVEAALALADKCEPKVRIGVHLGDVVVQPNGDLLGHGVNVAARLMARSDPGSVLVSADVRRTIRGPLAQRLVSRGSLQLDKMTETIEAFALGSAASVNVATPPTSTEPLLAVLPFDNLSDDREMQFFSDGVSEEIIQRLSRGAQMKVIGRMSSF